MFDYVHVINFCIIIIIIIIISNMTCCHWDPKRKLRAGVACAAHFCIP